MINKKIASEIAVGTVLILAIAVVGIFWMQEKNSVIGEQSSVIEKPQEPVNPEIIQSSEPVQVANEIESFVPDQLRKIDDLHLFKSREGDPTAVVSYYEVQSFDVGGASLILASDSYCDGAGCSPGMYRFLRKGNDFTLLTKYSFPIDGSYGVTEVDLNIEKFSNENISALNMPETLIDPKTKISIKIESEDSTSGRFFNPNDKTLIFSNDKWDVYSDDKNRNTVYYEVSSIDGLLFSYKLNDQFLENYDIKWLDGKKHINNFIVDPTEDSFDEGMTSCELGKYYLKAKEVSEITMSDLDVVGRNKNGQSIYGFSDADHPVLKAAQEQMMYAGNGFHDDPVDLVIFWENPFGELIRFVSHDMFNACGGKPVIYLYPQKEENVKVSLELKNGFSITEPEYLNGWNVVAKPNGELTEVETGRKYPYLFWEGGLVGYEMPKNGFVVEKSKVKEFFQEKLSYMGLNEKEIYDFSDFWVNRMKAKPYYFITFTLNDEIDKLAPLSISPNPDSIIRVLMDYTPLDEKIVVQELSLPRIERMGFTIVEWGGILK